MQRRLYSMTTIPIIVIMIGKAYSGLHKACIKGGLIPSNGLHWAASAALLETVSHVLPNLPMSAFIQQFSPLL